MNLNGAALGIWFVHVLLGGGLLLLLACLLAAWVRQPARRQWLGDCGVTAALVLALASLIGPTWLVLNWSMGGQVPGNQAPLLVQRTEIIVPERVEPTPDEMIVFPLDLQEPVNPAADPDPADLTNLDPAKITTWLGLGYLAVGGLFLTRWLMGHLALARLLKHAQKPPADVEGLFRRLASAQRRARLLVSPRVQVPMSCGVWRPTVVLPASMSAEPDLRRLRWVFVHELTHLERRDAWSCLLFGLGQGLFWGLPWFWWLRRQVRLCQEYIADAAAAAGEAHAADYAEFLLSLSGAAAVSPAATGVSGNGSDLFRRVAMLLQNPMRVEKHCPRRWWWAAGVALLALAVVGAGVGIRAEAADSVIIIIGGQDKDVKAPLGENVKAIRVGAEAPKEAVLELELRGEPGKRFEKKIDGPAGIAFSPDGNFILTLPVEQGKKSLGAGQPKLDVDAVMKKLKPSLDKLSEAEAREIRRALESLRGDVILEKIEGRITTGSPDGTIKIWDATTGKQVFTQPKALMQPNKPSTPNNPVWSGPVWWDGKQFGPGMDAYRRPVGGVADPTAKLNEVRKMLKDLEAQLAKHGQEDAAKELRKALQQLEGAPGGRTGQPLGIMVTKMDWAHLGLKVEEPSAVLADQLNLPKKKGLVVVKVEKDSPADKAGLRPNDVLLQVNGKALPVDLTEAKIAPGGKAQFEYLRKGQRAEANVDLGKAVRSVVVQDRVKVGDTEPVQSNLNIQRQGDRFTLTQQEGPLTITIHGKVVEGKARAETIGIQTGRERREFNGLEAVPPAYRERIEGLLGTLGPARGGSQLQRQ